MATDVPDAGGRWEDDAVQFPRLIAEIVATVPLAEEDHQALCEAMDLDPGDLDELFERAQARWAGFVAGLAS